MPSSLFDNAQNQSKNGMNIPQILEEFDKFSKTITPQEAEKRVKTMVAEGVIGKQKFEELKTQANGLLGFLNRFRR